MAVEQLSSAPGPDWLDPAICRNGRIARKLTRVDGVKKEKACELAEETLAEIIKPKLSPETALTLIDFVEKIYFPRIKQRVRASTVRGYRVIWDQVKPYCAKLWTLNVRTRHLQDRLEFHRARLGNPESGPVFPNEAGRPMDMNNLVTRVILPVLNRCVACKGSEAEHNEADHDYRRDLSLPA